MLDTKKTGSTLNNVKKLLSGSSDINVAEGLKFVSPKGFSRINDPKKITFTKDKIRLDIESFSVPVLSGEQCYAYDDGQADAR